jgi:hypothetical protein
VKDLCCNEVHRCLWSQKSLSEEHISMLPGKLKAHMNLGQGNKIPRFFEIIGGQ